MRRFAPALLLLIVAGSATAREVVFEGPRPVNAAAIERAAVQPSVSPDSLLPLLQAEGYLDAIAREQDGRIVIAAGEQARLTALVVIAGKDTTFASIDRPFTDSHVTEVVDSLLAGWRERGNYYVSSTAISVERYGNDIKLYFNVLSGPVMRLGDVHYTGLRRTSPAVLARYLPIQPGDSLTDRYLKRLEDAAGDIPFVRFYPPITVRPLPGYTAADLELQFAEDRPLALNLGGGYIPNGAESTPAEFAWHVDARLNNLFGGGRRAHFLSERREADRQVLRVSYAQPIFIAGRAEGRVEVATRDYRESFYEFALAAGYDTRLPQGFDAGVELGYRSVEPVGSLSSYDAYGVTFTARWDRVDFAVNPANGFAVRTTIGYVHRRYVRDTLSIASPERFNETRANLDAAFYRRVAGPLVAHAALGYRGLETSEDLPPLAELNLIGGPGTIRGYRNEQFAALRAALFTLEPRLRFNAGYLFGFYDGAYLGNRVRETGENGEGVRTEESFHSGFGLGIALADDLRGVKLSLGWNPDLAYEEPRLSIQFTSGI